MGWSSNLCGYALLKHIQIIWFIRSKLSWLPTPPCVAPGSSVSGTYSSCGCPRHRAEGSWGTAAGQPADRHTLHFTRGSRVNTNLAFSENLLSKSTQKSPLTSAEAGLGQCLALLRVFHLSLQVAKQDTQHVHIHQVLTLLWRQQHRCQCQPLGLAGLGSPPNQHKAEEQACKVPTAQPCCL